METLHTIHFRIVELIVTFNFLASLINGNGGGGGGGYPIPPGF